MSPPFSGGGTEWLRLEKSDSGGLGMLLRFGVSNHLSLKGYQEFSLVASKLKNPSSHLLQISGGEEQALPCAVLYGANASGKTNVLAAWSFFRKTILTSHEKNDKQLGTGRRPFCLDPTYQKSPSRFDCDVMIQGDRYHYGFVMDDDRVCLAR